MSRQVHVVSYEKEFGNCPLCGYGDGFHTMIKEDGPELKWLFICPSCHEIFDIGLTIKQ